jgi:hypothetical protein
MLFKSISARKNNNKVNSTTLAHDAYFNNLRDTEYKRLSEQGHIYLDYTGGNLYGISQIKFHNEILSNSVFGNPHSTNPSSQFATKLVEDGLVKAGILQNDSPKYVKGYAVLGVHKSKENVVVVEII